MSEKPEFADAIAKKTEETLKYFSAATAVFCFAVGAAVGFAGGKDSGIEQGKAMTKARVSEIAKEAKRDAEYAAGTQYSYLCWTMRQAAQKGAKTATPKAPYIVEMNQSTAEKCPMIPNPNVKVRIVF